MQSKYNICKPNILGQKSGTSDTVWNISMDSLKEKNV